MNDLSTGESTSGTASGTANGTANDVRDFVALDPALHGRNLLSDTDLAPEEIMAVLDTAAVLKKMRADHQSHPWLAGKTLGLIFQHPSTRTRTALQAGMEQLGGQAIFLGIRDLQLRRGETIRDTAEVFSRYVEGIAVRVENRQDMYDLAEGASVPVLNGLTSFDHPIEALSDLFTLKERFGTLKGLRFAYLGDGNNVCHSLLLTLSAVGVSVTVAGPERFRPSHEVVATAERLAAASGATVRITDDPLEAAFEADAIYTDVHESMGETVIPGKLMALAPFRVTRKLMAVAKPEAVFMHCLPLHRGQEVESEVADGPQSIIFDQAENRLHVHKAVLLQVLHGAR